jgi:hypothetical protein
MTELLLKKYEEFFVRGRQLRVDLGEPPIAQLQGSRVPIELWPLIPYAEFWGISDDGYRIELIKLAPDEVWQGFRDAVSKHKAALLDWLAGPDADSTPTAEYLAFSFILQAYDWPRA